MESKERQRSILLPPSEKLNAMGKDEVEDLMRELGAKGLNPVLREKNIPPELLTLAEGAERFLKSPNFKEYLEVLGSLDVQMKPVVFERSWWDIARSVEGVVVKSDEPLYEIDMRQYLEEYAEAETLDQKRKVMDKHAISLVKSHEYLDTRKLVETLKDGTFATAPGVGKVLIHTVSEIANHFIAEANLEAEKLS